MLSRRQMIGSAASFAGAAILDTKLAAAAADASPATQPGAAGGHTPVVTPDGSTAPYKLVDGVKVFHLTVGAFQREFAPGLTVECWGYNGQTPGPTIEAVEGDRVRIFVTNNLLEGT